MESRQLSPHDRGFTLIELLVVLLLLTITIGIVGINLGSNDSDRVRNESSRLAALLQTARDEAILQGQILAVQFQPDGYLFLRVNEKGTLTPLETDDTLRPRRLPEGMSLTVDIDGVPAENGAGLIFEPSGQLPSFVLTLRYGEAAWHTRNENGRIRALSPEALHAG
jgi:general secretion pathway protein H